MLSSQLEASITSRVVLTRPSHGQVYWPLHKHKKGISASVPFCGTSRISTLSSVKGEDGLVYLKQNNSHTK